MSEALKNGKKVGENGTVEKSQKNFSEFWALGMLPKWFPSINQQIFVTHCFFLYILCTVTNCLKKRTQGKKHEISIFEARGLILLRQYKPYICEASLKISDWSDEWNSR